MDLKGFIARNAGIPGDDLDRDSADSDQQKDFDNANLVLHEHYRPDPEIWWKQQPYTFVFNKEQVGDGLGGRYSFNLPISPSNISITTHFATNIVTTMYGTVEEHSEQRYFDINISGTTGMSPTYTTYGLVSDIRFAKIETLDATGKNIINSASNRGKQRASYSAASVISTAADTAGFLRRSANIAETVANQAKDLFGAPRPIGISTQNTNTGYMAFHNFYRFLLKYKKHTSLRSPNQPKDFHPLTFINWKDGNQYDVVITNFQLLREANNPMLYNYNISMRAYNLKQAGAGMGIGGDAAQTDLLDSLGLNGVKGSVKAFLARKARNARNAAYAAVALTKVAGQ